MGDMLIDISHEAHMAIQTAIQEIPYPDIREAGQFLFRMWRRTGDTRPSGYDWDDICVEYRDGGAAHCLEEGEGLDFFLHSMGWAGHGWYVLHGLKGTYSKDYYGEVDVEWDKPTIRRATLPEVLCGRVDATWSDVTMRSVFSFLYEEVHLLLRGVLPS